MASERLNGDQGLGDRIRNIRQRNRMTLRELADAAGVSESFVSQVERGHANPSVATLTRLAGALATTIAELFVGAEVHGAVVRAGERKRLSHPAGSLDDYLLTPQTARTMQIVYSIMSAGQGSGDEPYSHAADEECVVVISGQLNVQVADQHHELGAGDALLLDPRLPHSYNNPGPGTTVALWVTSPPVW